MKKIMCVILMVLFIVGFSFSQELSEDDEIAFIQDINQITEAINNRILGERFYSSTDIAREYFVLGFALALIEFQERIDNYGFLSEENKIEMINDIKISRILGYMVEYLFDEYRKENINWHNVTLKEVLKEKVWEGE